MHHPSILIHIQIIRVYLNVFNIEGTPEYINQVQTNVEEYATIVDNPSVWPGARGFDQEDD